MAKEMETEKDNYLNRRQHSTVTHRGTSLVVFSKFPHRGIKPLMREEIS